MFDRIRLASCLVLVLASQAHADVPPLVPHATTSIAIESSDAAHAWVAYPLNFSRGVPMEAYAQITAGAPLDPGRSWPDVYAFPAASVVEVTPAPALAMPAGPGLLGAPRAFRQSVTPFADHSLADFFGASQAPHATPLSPPADTILVAAHVTSLIDTYSVAASSDALTLRLLRTDYAFADGHTETLPSAGGARVLPGEASAPPSSVAPAPTSAPQSAPPPASGWGCSVGAGSSPWSLALAALALLVLRRAQRQAKTCSIASVAPTTMR